MFMYLFKQSLEMGFRSHLQFVINGLMWSPSISESLGHTQCTQLDPCVNNIRCASLQSYGPLIFMSLARVIALGVRLTVWVVTSIDKFSAKCEMFFDFNMFWIFKNPLHISIYKLLALDMEVGFIHQRTGYY